MYHGYVHVGKPHQVHARIRDEMDTPATRVRPCLASNRNAAPSSSYLTGRARLCEQCVPPPELVAPRPHSRMS